MAFAKPRKDDKRKLNRQNLLADSIKLYKILYNPQFNHISTRSDDEKAAIPLHYANIKHTQRTKHKRHERQSDFHDKGICDDATANGAT